MDRRKFTAGLFITALPAASRAGLAEGEAASGVRAALERGASAAVGLLGRNDGFMGDPRVRITLPGALEDAARLLRATGQGRKLDELVLAMNRAAEAAVPKARPLLVDAVRRLSVEDALHIVRGGGTAVTDFFAARTREPLAAAFLPVVSQATEKVSLASRYNAVAGKAAGLGLLKGDSTDIQHHVTARTLDGLFLMIGEEEKKIRADPVKTGSAILKKVFGG